MFKGKGYLYFLFSFSIFTIIINLLFVNNIFAGSLSESFVQSAGFNTGSSMESIVAQVIRAFLSLLGIIFVVLIIYAGFNWMTAQGDETKVTTAKNTIYRAVVGLVLTLGAFVITYFVFSSLPFEGSGVVGSGVTGSSNIESVSEESSSWWSSFSNTMSEWADGIESWWNDYDNSYQNSENYIDPNMLDDYRNSSDYIDPSLLDD